MGPRWGKRPANFAMNFRRTQGVEEGKKTVKLFHLISEKRSPEDAGSSKRRAKGRLDSEYRGACGGSSWQRQPSPGRQKGKRANLS